MAQEFQTKEWKSKHWTTNVNRKRSTYYQGILHGSNWALAMAILSQAKSLWNTIAENRKKWKRVNEFYAPKC